MPRAKSVMLDPVAKWVPLDLREIVATQARMDLRVLPD